MTHPVLKKSLHRLFTLAVIALVGNAWAGDVAQVTVDATDAPRGILKSHLQLPVTAGPLDLLYPKWIPGRHAPVGPITSLAGPRLTANGKPLAWRRDTVDPYVFHLVIPKGVSAIEADLEVLTAPAPDGVVQGLEIPRFATESLALVEWNQVVLYPAGMPTDRLSYQATVILPHGWQFATALKGLERTNDTQKFETTSLTTLVDSTLLAGRHWRDVELASNPAVQLHIAADREAQLAMSPATLEHYRNLVVEANALFGHRHYQRYDFLWILTDIISPDGIEHHESSDNRSPARTLLDDNLRRSEATLLAHEYVHSWNGKYRRPAGLATPDYQAPMQDDMLWIYEGLTEYLGTVLAARSGLLTQEEFRDEIARLAAQMDVHKGRDWRSLQDATDSAQLLYSQDRAWGARLRRQEDFYQESALIWLEADTTIRRLSKGQKSLDDFCRRFHGVENTGAQVRPYHFEDVVAALNAVQPYDWRSFWQDRLQKLGGGAPLRGIQAAGWRLDLNDNPSIMHVAHEVEDKVLNLQYSLGFTVDQDTGTVNDIVPGTPGDLARLAPGSHIIAINGHRWSRDALHDALASPRQAGGPLVLLIEKDDEFMNVPMTYSGTELYPNLVRDTGDDLLAAIGHPLAGR